ncbi:MAG: hypothetical protein KGY67_08280, partial [Candidatus Thermoplasmatota archaeon]|nr:hypothetical protein [Candidatus Thermoplasmatota archaeon]
MIGKKFLKTNEAKRTVVLMGTLVLGLIVVFMAQGAMAADLYVGTNDTYQSIQDAINASSEGDTIYINESLINEGNITVNQSVIIKNNGSISPVIDGLGNYGFNVTVSNVTIQNLTIKNCTATGDRLGIYVY